MNFLSLPFLFIFLPIVLSIWIALTAKGLNSTALLFMVLSSAFFYLGDSPLALILVVTSALLNFMIARQIILAIGKRRKYLLFIGVVINIIFLGYFKYSTFLIQLIFQIFDLDVTFVQQEFPIGISFYTISQIAYLCMLGRFGNAKQGLLEYLCFVLYFPKILAGPVTYFNEFNSQLGSEWRGHKSRLEDISVGLSLFCMGALKKVGFAEPLGQTANAIFSITNEPTFTTTAAWIGILAYTFQLYFDFSGYSDMAIGLSRMFGFRLPQNFNSPLRATSYLEFWQRWHMTMTRFFMQFVYNPIAISLTRKELSKKSKNLRLFIITVALPTLIAFIVSGLWHGSTMNFLCFGVISGLGLSINHAWRIAKFPKLPKYIGWFIMLTTVMTSLIFVRSSNLSNALIYLDRFFSISFLVKDDSTLLGNLFTSFIQLPPGVSMLDILHLLLALGVIILMPNTQWIMREYSPTLAYSAKSSGIQTLSRITWRPSTIWAILAVVFLVTALVNLSSQPFIYFSF